MVLREQNMESNNAADDRPVLSICLLSLECILGPHTLWIDKFTLPRQDVSAPYKTSESQFYISLKCWN